MGYFKYFVFLGLLGAASANISGMYVPNFGWKVTFNWQRTMEKETLQNLTIWRNGEELYVFKPQGLEPNTPLTKNLTTGNTLINISCQHDPNTQKGACDILVGESQFGGSDDAYRGVQVWGPPHWQRVTEEKTVMALATKPLVRETQEPGHPQVLNCSSEGVPYPIIMWTLIVKNKTVEIPADFNRTTWNATTKLWNSWSVFKPLGGKQFNITCTPKQVTIKGDIILSDSPVSVLVNRAMNLDINFVMAVFLAIVLVCNITANF